MGKAADKGQVKIRRPRKGSKAEAILTLTTTTPATPPEIAESVNTSPQHVHQTLQRYGLDANTVDSFKKHRADIFAGLQHRLLDSIEADDIKKAPMGSRVLAAAQLFDKERLERDLSTDNVFQVTDIIQRIRAQDDGLSTP
jgi:hypothetical protein